MPFVDTSEDLGVFVYIRKTFSAEVNMLLWNIFQHLPPIRMSAFWATAAFLSRSLYLDQKKKPFPVVAPELCSSYPGSNCTGGICTRCEHPASRNRTITRVPLRPMLVVLFNHTCLAHRGHKTNRTDRSSGKHKLRKTPGLESSGVCDSSSKPFLLAVKLSLKFLWPLKQLCYPCFLSFACLALIIVFLNAR